MIIDITPVIFHATDDEVDSLIKNITESEFRTLLALF